MTAEPCADCKTTGGYVHPRMIKPMRQSGAAYGFDGTLCNACKTRHHKRLHPAKWAGSHKAKPKAAPLVRAAPAKKTKTSPLTLEQSQLAADNQGLVWRAALKLQNRGLDLDDLVSEGQFGLIHACRKFDPERGIQFSTYATWCIRGRILQGIDDLSRTIRVPAHLHTKENRGSFGAYQPPAEADLGVPLCELAIQRKGPDPLEEAEENEQVADLLGFLKPRAAQILRLRFGISGEKQTLEEIGAALGIHKERVRQVQNEALRHLRERVGVAS